MTRLARLALCLVALLALLVARPATATASTRAALDACIDLLPLAAHDLAASTPVSPGCAQRSPSSASASPALGETDGAQRRRVGASNDWQYTYAGTPHAPTQIGQKAFLYDPSGNQIAADDLTSGKIRTAKWDEENRLQEISDNGKTTRFKYDAAGQRVIKRGAQGET